MATTKPRLTLSLNPETYAIARRLAKAQGRPTATVLSEYYEQAAPLLERIAEALENIQAQTLQVQADKALALDAISGDIDAVQPVLLGLLSKLGGLGTAEGPEGAGEAPGGPEGAGEGPQPPVCNHGGQISLYSPTGGGQ